MKWSNWLSNIVRLLHCLINSQGGLAGGVQPIVADMDENELQMQIPKKPLFIKCNQNSNTCANAIAGDIKVEFVDLNLEKTIRKAMRKPKEPILKLDLEQLTDLLDASDKTVANLIGLKHCTHIARLFLMNNQISDITPLNGLTNLQILSLENNQINDVSPLTGLTNLQELGLGSNKISDISSLSNLTNLQTLQLYNNQIRDISHLGSLTNLMELRLYNNQIRDISRLSNLTNLQGLNLAANQIGEIKPLSSLTNLKWLILGSNQINDISPLSSLTNLKWLYLDNNQIRKISHLVSNAGMGEGDEVDLKGNPLSDEAYSVHIPALIEKGVNVLFNPKR